MAAKEPQVRLAVSALTLLSLVLCSCRGLVNTTSTSSSSIDHVIFMLQENRTFDTYFGMLNPYRQANQWNVGDDGNTYNVDGIDDKLTKFANQDDEGQSFSLFKLNTTCVDDMTSAWLESYGDVNRYDFSVNRSILMDGFVHTAEGFAKSGAGDGSFTDAVGQRAMGYYDQGILNYYYYMASQFAISDRWFSPVSSKSTPNRIATMTGGTTQGLVRDPFADDGFTNTLNVETIFQELDRSNVSWKIYYSITAGGCTDDDGDCGAGKQPNDYPVTTFSDFSYSSRYLYANPQHSVCASPTVGSQQAVGDASDAFCIDTTHIAPLKQYLSDVQNNTLPSYAFIEAAYGSSDEHPGSGQSILEGQQQVSTLINALMQSASWSSSVFFLSYDEPGGPFDHVPPVPGHSNDNTDGSLGAILDISTIAVNADSYEPCLPPGGAPTLHCDLESTDPGANPGDAPAQQGFAAQLGFRLPNLVISPFSRRHYVSHIPMDHTAIIKFVENRFINSSAHLTSRDAAQPDLLDFFDFGNVPWATPPMPPTPNAPPGSCTPQDM
jgi:phospholipase C